MPRFTVTSRDGRTITLEGENAPTEQDLDEIFAQLPINQKPTLGERADAAIKEAAGAAGPALAGLAVAGRTGLALAPFGPVASITGSVVAGIATSMGAQWLQDQAAKGVMGEDAYNEMMANIQKRREEMPVSTAVGQLLPQLVAMKPNVKNVAEAIKDSKQILGGAKAFKAWAENPANAERAANIMNVGIGAAVPGAMTTYQELTDDKEGINSVKLATDILAGAALNDPTKFGSRLMGIKPATPVEIAASGIVPRSDDYFVKKVQQELEAKAAGKEYKPVDVADDAIIDYGSSAAKTKMSQVVNRLKRDGTLTDEDLANQDIANNFLYETKTDAKTLRQAEELRAAGDDKFVASMLDKAKNGLAPTDADRVAINMLWSDVVATPEGVEHPMFDTASSLQTWGAGESGRALRAGRLGLTELVTGLDKQQRVYDKWRSEMIAKKPELAKTIPEKISTESQQQLKGILKLKAEVERGRGAVSMSKGLADDFGKANTGITDTAALAGDVAALSKNGGFNDKEIERLLVTKYGVQAKNVPAVVEQAKASVAKNYSSAKKTVLSRLAELEKIDYMKPYVKNMRENIDAYMDLHTQGKTADMETWVKAVDGRNDVIDPVKTGNASDLEDAIQFAMHGKETKAVREGLRILHDRSIYDVVPTELLAKVRAAQTMLMLGNLKTPLANYTGNTVFGALKEANAPISYTIDKLASFFTGKRTVDYKFGGQIGGAKGILGTEVRRYNQDLERAFLKREMAFEQARKLAKDITVDVLRNTSKSKYDPDLVNGYVRRSFGKGIAKRAEDALTIALGATDAAAARAATNEAMRQELALLRAGQIDSVDMGRVIIARNKAIYADDNAISRALVDLRKWLNKRTGSEHFGLGDFIIKFPGVPGSILAKGLDYSPVGFIRAAYELLAPNFTRGHFNQREFVRSFSEALTGTGLAAGAGYFLKHLGVLSTQLSEDKDIAALQKAQGYKENAINASLLYRKLITGDWSKSEDWQEDDLKVPYGWAQPLSLPLSLGANAYDMIQQPDDKQLSGFAKAFNVLTKVGTAAEGTITNEKLFSGIMQVAQGATYAEQAGESPLLGALKAPILASGATFVPALVRQINDVMDNKARQIDYGTVDEFWQRIAANTPWLADKLPVAYDVFGHEKEKYVGDSNTLLNVMVSPATVSRLKLEPTGQEVLALFNATGETKQAPNQVGRKMTITRNGESEKVELTPELRSKMQQMVGTLTLTLMQQEMMADGWSELDADSRVKKFSHIASDTLAATKAYYLGHELGKSSKKAKALLRHLKQGEQ